MIIRVSIAWGAFIFLILLISLFILDKQLFDASENIRSDGFYGQIEPFLGEIDFFSLEPLQYIHFLRFLVVSPFLVGYLLDLGAAYYSIIIFLFALPILKINKGGFYNYLKYMVLLIPLVISFRGFLVACAIAYLFIALYHHRSYILLLLSLCIATLSSGVVLVWLLMFIINFNLVFKEYRLFVIVLLGLVVVVFLPSVLHKISFAKEELNAGLMGYFVRGTLVVSFIEGQWARFVFYIVCILVLFSISIRWLVSSSYQKFYLSYAPVLIGATFEGLGLICGLIIIIMFYAGFRPRPRYWLQRLKA